MSILVTRKASSSSAADADFAARSAQAIADGGVVYGFDNQPEVDNNYTNGSSGKRGFYDTSTKVGSGGSLRLDLSAGANDPQLTGGWSKSSSPWVLGRGYGEGSSLYIQYRARITTTMNSNLNQWDSYWKQLILHSGTNTCAPLDLVLTHPEPSTIYTRCTSPHCFTGLTTPTWDETGDQDHLIQQQDWDIAGGGPTWGHMPHGYFVTYGQSVSSGGAALWAPTPNTWYTVYLQCNFGTFDNDVGGPKDSTIILDIQEQGNAFYHRVIACFFPLVNNVNHSDVFNNLTLTAFMTGLTQGASSDASMWYDQLICSPAPIAIPSISLT